MPDGGANGSHEATKPRRRRELRGVHAKDAKGAKRSRFRRSRFHLHARFDGPKYESLQQDEPASLLRVLRGFVRNPFTCFSAPLRAQIQKTHQPPRWRARDSAKEKRSNGRQPVRGCSNRTSVAVRSSLRTTDGETHETVHSALRQRAATGRTRVLPVRPKGTLLPLRRQGCRSLPLPLSVGGVALAKRAPAVKRRREAKR